MRFGMGMGMRPRGGWVALSGAALDLDFARNQASGGTFAGLTVVRTHTNFTSAYAEDTSGILYPFIAATLRQTNKGLLVEESRINLCLQSQTFGTTWSATGVVVSSDATAAPDVTTTADTLTADGLSSAHQVTQSITWTTATAYTLSVYAKAGTLGFVQITVGTGVLSTAGYVNYTLSGAGTATTGGTGMTGTITVLANGWYRCVATFTSTAGAAALFHVGVVTSAAATRAPTTTASGTVHVWGGQVEAGAFSTSYIPTTTLAATRAADVVTLATASISGFSATAGTLYAEGSPHYAAIGSQLATLASFDDATSNERWLIRRTDNATTGQAAFIMVDGGATVVAATSANGSWLTADSHKLTFAHGAANAIGCDNGTLTTPDTVYTVPTVTRLAMGSGAGSNAMNGYLKRAAYWNTRLANVTLQSLTT